MRGSFLTVFQPVLPLHECADPTTDESTAEPLHFVVDSIAAESAVEPLQSVTDSAAASAALIQTS
jgi:hypothetical protein